MRYKAPKNILKWYTSPEEAEPYFWLGIVLQKIILKNCHEDSFTLQNKGKFLGYQHVLGFRKWLFLYFLIDII